MVACSILSILMLGAAGTMIDTHRRDWRRKWGAAHRSAPTCEPEQSRWRFALSRHRRRMTASVLLAVAAVLIALWPATPRTPFWVINYTAALSLTALGLLVCGVLDALASTRYYGKLTRDLAERQREQLTELLTRRADETTPPNRDD